MKLIKGEGPKNAKIILVGEAPGQEEERANRPFVGKAGKLLTSALEAAGISCQEIYITNVVKFRPTAPAGGNRKPRPDEIKKFLPLLRRELARLKPKIIVLLGDVARRALLGSGYKVSRDHGKIVKLSGRNYLISYHPSPAGRFPRVRQAFFRDILKLKKFKK